MTAYRISAAIILDAAADHMNHVGLYKGRNDEWRTPGDHSPCNLLDAFDWGQYACRPPGEHRDDQDQAYYARWRAYHAARHEALRVLADHAHGAPITVVPDRLKDKLSLETYRHVELSQWGYTAWGSMQTRETADAVALLREAARIADGQMRRAA